MADGWRTPHRASDRRCGAVPLPACRPAPGAVCSQPDRGRWRCGPLLRRHRTTGADGLRGHRTATSRSARGGGPVGRTGASAWARRAPAAGPRRRPRRRRCPTTTCSSGSGRQIRRTRPSPRCATRWPGCAGMLGAAVVERTSPRLPAQPRRPAASTSTPWRTQSPARAVLDPGSRLRSSSTRPLLESAVAPSMT